MDSQSSNLSLILSDPTFKYIREQLPDSWSNYELSQELTALKSKDLNNISSSDEQDKVEKNYENQNCVNNEALDLSRKGFCSLELLHEPKVQDEWERNVSFPSSERMVGRFNFDVKFREAKRVTKSISYTYSERLEMLFVRPQQLCAAVISTHGDIPPSTKLFITPMFLLSHHASDPVRACPNHMATNDETSRHLIRMDLDGACYGTHKDSNHHFVCIDYHKVSRGRNTFNIPLKFQCFSTCLGGIARRPFQVIYSLENENGVLGRKPIKTRVCSCPGRDKRAREKEKFGTLEDKQSSAVTLRDYGKDNNENSEHQFSRSPKSKTYRTIKTQDAREYSILMKVVTHLREHSGTSCGCKQFFISLC